jgi:molybdopterin molybdotransferase
MKMITFEEGYSVVMQFARPGDTEQVELNNSLGRVLAEDIFSDVDMPPFNKSAVDGYACRKLDLENELTVIETIPAGVVPEKLVGQYQCAKIMTGAVVPEGADTVIMVEDTEEVGYSIIKFSRNKTHTNICYTGEDVRINDHVLSKGTLIRPQDVAVLASVGKANPMVYKKIKVGIISTGNELVEPGKVPSKSQIRNSNASQLVAQVKNMGAEPHYLGIALDTKKSTFEKISQAIVENDVVLLTGGVSMGDFDYVPEVFNDLNIKTKFKSLAIQPGRPTVFGVTENCFLFGLPGNPVSSFVLFEVLVKPFVYQLMGYHFDPVPVKLPMGRIYSRKKSARKSLIPVTISKDGCVYPVEYHGSAHIHSYVFADGVTVIEIGETSIEKGDIVDVRQI